MLAFYYLSLLLSLSLSLSFSLSLTLTFQPSLFPPKTGLKSAEYLALNPQGKMPLLVLPCGTPIPESDTIARFVLDEYKAEGPSFDPGTPLLRAKSDLAARILDIYVTPNQGCLYKVRVVKKHLPLSLSRISHFSFSLGLALLASFALTET